MTLRDLRREKGWSQEQLADISGVSARTIQRLEKGETTGMDTSKALAAAFDMPLTDLQQYMNPNQEQNSMNADISTTKTPFYSWKAFFIHLATYIVVITWLFGMSRFFELDYGIATWIGFGWGFYIVLHGFNVATSGE